MFRYTILVLGFLHLSTITNASHANRFIRRTSASSATCLTRYLRYTITFLQVPYSLLVPRVAYTCSFGCYDGMFHRSVNRDCPISARSLVLDREICVHCVLAPPSRLIALSISDVWRDNDLRHPYL